ncbi:clostri-philic family protein [uncultured Clostridium sp.]|nr:clostri-philic family protein [uncultured Clostridium sp.]
MVSKEGAINPIQKGKRRQRLHKNQNNVGEDQKPSYYENFNGEPIE